MRDGQIAVGPLAPRSHAFLSPSPWPSPSPSPPPLPSLAPVLHSFTTATPSPSIASWLLDYEAPCSSNSRTPFLLGLWKSAPEEASLWPRRLGRSIFIFHATTRFRDTEGHRPVVLVLVLSFARFWTTQNWSTSRVFQVIQERFNSSQFFVDSTMQSAHTEKIFRGIFPI